MNETERTLYQAMKVANYSALDIKVLKDTIKDLMKSKGYKKITSASVDPKIVTVKLDRTFRIIFNQSEE